MDKNFDRTKSSPDPEHDLIWDEYKYRHELIWKHMIRSTIVIIGIILLPFSKDYVTDQLKKEPSFLLLIGIAAIIYVLFTFIVINKEITLLEKIKAVHRRKQFLKFGIHKEYIERIQEQEKSQTDEKGKNSNQWLTRLSRTNFRWRVNIFLMLLLVLAVVSFMLNYCS